MSADHPVRPIRRMVDIALDGLSVSFDEIYAASGRPSIHPEKLLRAPQLPVRELLCRVPVR